LKHDGVVVKTKRIILIAALVMGTTTMVWGDDLPIVFRQSQAPPLHLTGNMRIDLVGQRELANGPNVQAQTEVAVSTSHKSQWLAAGMSLLVPGTGEFYAESYWKSAAFFALDVVVWALAYSYDRRGDRQTDDFQNYADVRWSVWKYAEYAEKYLAPSGQIYQWRKNPALNPSVSPWLQVDWNELNRMERDVAASGFNGYTHTLAPHGDQQYYELIGKYPQFNQGWDDSPPTFDATKDPVTAHFVYYAGTRGRANDLYNSATTFVTIGIVNHILSAIDAAWSASSFNNSLHAQVGVQVVPEATGVVRVPVMKISYSF
jgi:hypothetical protein